MNEPPVKPNIPVSICVRQTERHLSEATQPGVNGEIVTFTVPGAITIGFTGQSVKFPDGKQLQRVGLVPDIEVKPTIKGIRENQDEVLEKAIKFY